LANPKDIHIKICLNTANYFLYDYIVFALLAKQKGPLATQVKVHHILSVLIFWATLETEGAPAMYGVVSLFLEVSNMFVNLRWFIFEYGITNPIVQFFNSGMLFLTYLVFRVVYHSWISFTIAWPWTYKLFVEASDAEIIKLPRESPLFYRFVGIFCWIVNLLSQFINLYWFSLIMKQVQRNFLKATGQQVKEAEDP